MRDRNYLFNNADWHSVDQHQRKELAKEVDSINGDRLLNSSIDDLCDYFEKKYRIEVPVLRPENIVAAQVANARWLQDHEQLAHGLARAQDWAGARGEFEKLASVSPNPAGFILDAALCACALGEHAAAERLFRRVLTLPGVEADDRAVAEQGCR